MITIAGRQVQIGDSLYHIGLRAWGSVTGYDVSGVAKLTIAGANSNSRVLYVQQGGNVNGQRMVYWHEQLRLDLPRQDIQRYQRLVDLLVAETEQ